MTQHKTGADDLISRCNSWGDFTSAVNDLGTKEKGDAFERLTQLYLLTKPEYRLRLKDVWLLDDLPSSTKRRLKNLPSRDEGIDLVAETDQGEFWAVQCKYKSDSGKSLTVKELSTFTSLAFVACKGSFSQALVSHSLSKPVKKPELIPDTTEVGLQRWLELTGDDWRLIHGKLKNKSSRPTKRSPRRHQREAINNAKQHFQKDKQSRGKLLMPCGTGKSLTAFWIAQALDAKTTLVVVPSLSLVKQSVEDWTQEFVAQNVTPAPEWLCVCSDKTVGNVSKDEFVGSVYDLGLPVTTDSNEIKRFLTKRTEAKRVIFVTYQSGPVFAKAVKAARRVIDLAIFDEAHKTAGDKNKSFASLLFDENLKVRKRIFMTATERVMQGANDDVVSMDSPEEYGDCFHQLSFKKAIHSEPAIISDYKILTFSVTDGEIEQAIRERALVSDADAEIQAEDSRQIAAAIALRKAYKKYKIKHAVSFHRSIQAAEEFSKLHSKLNDVKMFRPKVESFHISSQKSAGQRTELLKDFAESSRSLITNAKCLTEGVDVPAIDCVLFADPKQSVVDIVQAAGRALRPFQGKEFGYIMLPIIVPDGMTVEEFGESTDFRAVSKVITALSTQDERIAEEFRVTTKATRSRGKVVEFDGTVPVGMQIGLRKFAAAVSAKVWERVAKVNRREFKEARKFVRNLNFKSTTEWQAFTKSGKLPNDIPKAPHFSYQDEGWISMGDWLGTGTVAPKNRVFRPFEEAREFVRSLELKSQADWQAFTKSGKLPDDIPTQPAQVYRDKGWVGFGDWLGTGTVASQNRVYRPFKDARQFVQRFKLKSQREWYAFCRAGKRPDDIPSNPQVIYRNKGWNGWGDWLGNGNKKRNA